MKPKGWMLDILRNDPGPPLYLYFLTSEMEGFVSVVSTRPHWTRLSIHEVTPVGLARPPLLCLTNHRRLSGHQCGQRFEVKVRVICVFSLVLVVSFDFPLVVCPSFIDHHLSPVSCPVVHISWSLILSCSSRHLFAHFLWLSNEDLLLYGYRLFVDLSTSRNNQ